MDNNTKNVRFGTKQEAIITPKEGYEVESVTVVNTADNSVIPSELKQNEETPNQWVCSFLQPAAHVVIKPVTRPILYSVSFEVSDTFTVVLVEQDSMADIEITSAANEQKESEETAEEQNTEKEDSDFKEPQHSVKEGAEDALDVGGKEGEETDASSYTQDITTENADVQVEEAVQQNENNVSQPEVEDAAEVVIKTSDSSEVVEDNSSDGKEPDNTTGGGDVAYDAGDYAEELEDFEPIVITQKQYDDRNTLYWSWRGKYDEGKCPEEKFEKIRKKHKQWIDDIQAGRIIVK